MGGVGPTDVEEHRVHGVLGARANNALLVLTGGARLFAGDEARSHQDGLRAEAECGDQSAPRRNTSGGDDGQWCHRLNYRGNQRHERGGTAHVSAGLESLRDDRVDAGRGSAFASSTSPLGNTRYPPASPSRRAAQRRPRREVAPDALLDASFHLAALQQRKKQARPEGLRRTSAGIANLLANGAQEGHPCRETEASGLGDSRGELRSGLALLRAARRGSGDRSRDRGRDGSSAYVRLSVECTDHDVIPIRITQCEFAGAGTGIQMGFLFQFIGKGARPQQRLIEVIDTKEQEESIARVVMIGTAQWRVLVGSPLVQAEQDRSIGVQDGPEVIMRGFRFRLTEQRLIPLAAASNVSHTDDCPRAFHRFLQHPSDQASLR